VSGKEHGAPGPEQENRDAASSPGIGAERTPYSLIGGRDAVIALAERFYDAMDQYEPALAALHECDPPGKVSRRSRDRFGLFLVGWLGGPQDYMALHGHPRLRMRHGRVTVDIAMRDAWLRSMQRALDACEVHGELRGYLDARFAEVADFLRNVHE
jgi:hemoglobin